MVDARMKLAPRELEVLRTIVEDYIAHAAPVGSRTVSKRSGLTLSPASIRNTMADLTDMGFLEQPHTSAGRAPTAKAFRFYLDQVLRPAVLSEQEQALITQYLGGAGLELTDILRQCSRLLSSLSNQVSMVLAPPTDDVRWRNIDFVSVRPGLAMAILVLEGGMMQNRLITVDQKLTQDDLVTFSNFLNHHFTGLTLTAVRLRVLRELSGARERLDALTRRALRLARDAFETSRERDLFVDGTLNLLSQPGFTDIATMRELLALLEERTRLLHILDSTIEGGRIKVCLGRDELDDLKDYSLVSTPYGCEDGARGVVGVMGPLRMDYAKVMPLVDFTARMLTELLKKRF